MGKTRAERLSIKKNHTILHENNDKITLTSKQLNDIIVRVRMNQMQQCGWNRSQIEKTLECNQTTITRWQNVGLDDPSKFVEKKELEDLKFQKKLKNKYYLKDKTKNLVQEE